MLKKILLGAMTIMACTTDSFLAAAEKIPAVLNYTVENIDGEEVKLSKYQGRVVLVVNLASR